MKKILFSFLFLILSNSTYADSGIIPKENSSFMHRFIFNESMFFLLGRMQAESPHYFGAFGLLMAVPMYDMSPGDSTERLIYSIGFGTASLYNATVDEDVTTKQEITKTDFVIYNIMWAVDEIFHIVDKDNKYYVYAYADNYYFGVNINY